MRDNYGQANSGTVSLVGNNSGTAIDAFENCWQKFGGSKGCLPLGARACDAMSNSCTQYAERSRPRSEMSAGQFSTLLSESATTVATSNPQLFVDMRTLFKQLERETGKVSVGVLASAASQLISTQQINAEGVASDQLVELLKGAAEG